MATLTLNFYCTNFLYEFLSLIGEYNKARQSMLALEMKWPMKCCWFQLMTTFIDMAVVDIQRWDCNMRKIIPRKKEISSVLLSFSWI